MHLYCLLLLLAPGATPSEPTVTVVPVVSVNWNYFPSSTSLEPQRLTLDPNFDSLIPFAFLLVTTKGVTGAFSISVACSIEGIDSSHSYLRNQTISRNTLYSVQWFPPSPTHVISSVTVRAYMEHNGELYSVSGAYFAYAPPTPNDLLHISIEWQDPTLNLHDVSPLHWDLKPDCEWSPTVFRTGHVPVVLYQWEQPLRPWRRENEGGPRPAVYGLGFDITADPSPYWGRPYELKGWQAQVWGTAPYSGEYELLTEVFMNFHHGGAVVQYSGVIEVVILDPNGVEINWGYNDDVVLRTYHQILIRGNFVDPKDLAGHSNFTLTDCSFSNIVDSKGMFNMSVNVATGYSSHTLKITPSTKVKVTPDNQRMNFSFTCSNTDICTPSNPCDRTNLLYTDYQFTPPPTEVSKFSALWYPLDQWCLPDSCYWDRDESLYNSLPHGTTASQYYAHPGKLISLALVPQIEIDDGNGKQYVDCMTGFTIDIADNHKNHTYTAKFGDTEIPQHTLFCADGAIHAHSQTLFFQLVDDHTGNTCTAKCAGTVGIHKYQVSVSDDNECNCWQWMVTGDRPVIQYPTFHLVVDDDMDHRIPLPFKIPTGLFGDFISWEVSQHRADYEFDIPALSTVNVFPRLANITVEVGNKNVTYLLNNTFYESPKYKSLKKPLTLGNAIWAVNPPPALPGYVMDGWTVYKEYDYTGPPPPAANVTFTLHGLFTQPWNYTAQHASLFFVDRGASPAFSRGIDFNCSLPAHPNATFISRIMYCKPNITSLHKTIHWQLTEVHVGDYLRHLFMLYLSGIYISTTYYTDQFYSPYFRIHVEERPPCEGCTKIAYIISAVAGAVLLGSIVTVVIARKPKRVEYEDD